MHGERGPGRLLKDLLPLLGESGQCRPWLPTLGALRPGQEDVLDRAWWNSALTGFTGENRTPSVAVVMPAGLLCAPCGALPLSVLPCTGEESQG